MSRKPTVSSTAALLPSRGHLLAKWGWPKPPLLLFTFTLILPLSLLADSSLSAKSPFLPPGHGVKPPEPATPEVQPQGQISREIEFRGIAQIGGVYQFSVYNKKDQKGYWLKEDQGQDGIAVSNFDENASSLVVLMNGRSERLTLMSASEAPLPVAQTKPSTPGTSPSVLPPELQNTNPPGNQNRRSVPRRRVILPKKN